MPTSAERRRERLVQRSMAVIYNGNTSLSFPLMRKENMFPSFGGMAARWPWIGRNTFGWVAWITSSPPCTSRIPIFPTERGKWAGDVNWQWRATLYTSIEEPWRHARVRDSLARWFAEIPTCLFGRILETSENS